MIETTLSFITCKWLDYGAVCIKRSSDYGGKNPFLQFLDGHDILMDLMMKTTFNGNFNQSYKVVFLGNVIRPTFFNNQRINLRSLNVIHRGFEILIQYIALFTGILFQGRLA